MNVAAVNETERALASGKRPLAIVVVGGEVPASFRTSVKVLLSGEAPAELRGHDPDLSESPADLLLEQTRAASLERAHNSPNSADAWAQAGHACLAADDFAGAIASFEESLRVNPSHKGAQLGLPRAYFELGSADEALRLLKEMNEQDATDLDVLVALAVVYVSRGEFDAALNVLNVAVPLTSKSAALFAARGGVRIAAGDFRSAVGDLRKAIRLRPDWVQARNALGLAEFKLGRLKEAERRFHEAMRISPTAPEAAENLLRVLLFEKRYDEAIWVGKEAARSNIIGAEIYRLVGLAAIADEKWNVARDWLERALTETDDTRLRSTLLNDIGVTLSRIERLQDAGDLFERSFAESPSALAQINRARVFLLADQPLLALGWLHQTGLIDASSTFEYWKTVAKASSLAGFYDAAVEIGSRLVDSRDGDVDLFALLGVAYADGLRRYDDAIAVLRTGLERFPTDPLLNNNLAYSYLQAGRPLEAEQILSGIGAASGTTRVAITATRGLLAFWKGDMSEGRRLYDLAFNISKSDGVAARVRAKRDLEHARAILRLGGRKEDAIRLLRAAIDVGSLARTYVAQAAADLRSLGEPE